MLPTETLLSGLSRAIPEEWLCEEIRRPGTVIDWSQVCELGDKHCLLPILHETLHHMGLLKNGYLPKEMVSRLEKGRQVWLLRNLLSIKELERISEAVTEEKIPVLVIKGPVLAELVYRDISLRPFSDLDIVVHPRHRGTIGDLLRKLGYRYMPSAGLPEDSYQAAIIDGGPKWNALWLDVHHDISALMRLRGRRYDIRDMWRASAPYKSPLVRRLCWEDFLCHLATHASLDSYSRFVLLCDIDRLLRIPGFIDWPKALDRAARCRCTVDLWLALDLAKSMLGTEIPKAVSDVLAVGHLRRVMVKSHINEQSVFAEVSGSPRKLLFRVATTDRYAELPVLLFNAAKIVIHRFAQYR